MEKEVEKSFTKVVEQVESYLGIRRLVKEENYAGALDKVKSSPLSSSTKEHLVNALETDDKDDKNSKL